MSEGQLCTTYQVVWACLWVLGSLTCAGCARGAGYAALRCRPRRNAEEVEGSGEVGCSAATGGLGCVGERGWWCRFVSLWVLGPRVDVHGNRSLYLWRKEKELEHRPQLESAGGNIRYVLTWQGCVSWCQLQGAPSAAPKSPGRKPWWCSEGCAHAGTGIGLGSAWLPGHSGVAPSAEEASWPGRRKEKDDAAFHHDGGFR